MCVQVTAGGEGGRDVCELEASYLQGWKSVETLLAFASSPLLLPSRYIDHWTRQSPGSRAGPCSRDWD